jgi:hypothetical protein
MYWRALGSTGFDGCAPNKLFNRYSEANRSYALTVSHVLIHKVKQSHNTLMEAQGEEKVYNFYSFTTSALEVGEWSASRPGRTLPPGKGPLDTHWTGGWMGPEPVWTKSLEEKSSCLCPGWNLDRSVVQSVARHCTDWATPAPVLRHITPSEISVSLYLSEIT